MLIAGVALPAILALIPFAKISFPALIGLSVLSQSGALIFGLRSWQRTQGKIVACTAGTLLMLIGILVMLMLSTHDGAFESANE